MLVDLSQVSKQMLRGFLFQPRSSRGSLMASLTSKETSSAKKYAVVTGANKGIGFEICRQLSSQGISVILTSRNVKRGLEAVEKLKKSGLSDDDQVTFHQLDVVDSSSVDALASFVGSQFGKLDILVNNAGASGSSSIGGRNTYELAEDCLKTNYYGLKQTTETLIPLLQLSNSPRIVNISSSMGKLSGIHNRWARETLSEAQTLTEEKIDRVISEFLKDLKEGSLASKGWPSSNWGAYSISKAAVTAYTRILARKYPNMTINSVCPGWVSTDLSNHSGLLTPEEGAKGPVRLALLPDGEPSGMFFYRDKVSSF